MPKETPIMELMREIEGMNPSIIDPKRMIEKLRSYIPAEREMIEEVYEQGVFDKVYKCGESNSSEYYSKTFKQNDDEK